MGNFGAGQSIRRVEDARFLTGKGRYTDDITLPGQVYLYVLRSPHAHANITALDTAAAKAAPGVRAVLTHADIEALGFGSLPTEFLPPAPDGGRPTAPYHPMLARDRVCFVGEPVAAVVADTLAAAKDAAELIEVDYEELPAVALPQDAVKPGAPVIHPKEAPGNVLVHWHLGDKAATDAAFAKAHKVVGIDLVNTRIAPTAIEPRAAIGQYDKDEDRYTLIQGSQGSHKIREWASRATGIPEARLRVICPDVGGGFGMKNFLFNEPPLCLAAAKILGVPVKWTADRSESFLSDAHGRDQVSHAELAVDRDGTFLAIRVSSLGNIGAYVSQYGALIPTMAGGAMYCGAYRIPAAHLDVKVVMTNTVPLDAYRGAGRPEAAYLVERLVEKAAAELGMPSVELRRLNFIRPEDFPHTTPFGSRYDSGHYAELMDAALVRASHAGFESRRAEARTRGKLRGIGISYYVEACAGGKNGEKPHLMFDKNGHLTILIGTQSNGQGHETVYAQVAADTFGIPMDRITVKQGDTDEIPTGNGTGGSRSIPIGASAVRKTLTAMLEQGKAIAADMLEAAAEDMEFASGEFRIAGTDRTVSLDDVIAASFDDARRPDGKQPGLYESENYAPAGSTYPNGCHVCEVEIDESTGALDFVRYTIQDDLGVAMNPLLMEGQILGGAVQGLGQALFEEAVYDAGGQLTTGSFMDYCMPRADNTPRFDFAYTEIPTPNNIMGIKGAGEAGTIGATPAVANAVLDALKPLGVTHLDMPLTPLKIWQAIQAATTRAA